MRKQNKQIKISRIILIFSLVLIMLISLISNVAAQDEFIMYDSSKRLTNPAPDNIELGIHVPTLGRELANIVLNVPTFGIPSIYERTIYYNTYPSSKSWQEVMWEGNPGYAAAERIQNAPTTMEKAGAALSLFGFALATYAGLRNGCCPKSDGGYRAFSNRGSCVGERITSANAAYSTGRIILQTSEDVEILPTSSMIFRHPIGYLLLKRDLRRLSSTFTDVSDIKFFPSRLMGGGGKTLRGFGEKCHKVYIRFEPTINRRVLLEELMHVKQFRYLNRNFEVDAYIAHLPRDIQIDMLEGGANAQICKFGSAFGCSQEALELSGWFAGWHSESVVDYFMKHRLSIPPNVAKLFNPP